MFLKNKKYILDGGSGQTLLEMGLKTSGDLWSAQALLDKNYHSMVLEMHKNFIKAGSEIIVTANFSARRRLLGKYNLNDSLDYAIKSAGQIARKSADEFDKKIIVAGSLPNQSNTYSPLQLETDQIMYQDFYNVAKNLINNITKNIDNISAMIDMVTEAEKILLNQKKNIDEIGELLNNYWTIKKKLSNTITLNYIEEIYDKAIKSGAIGGKLLGAGSWGFLLLYVNDKNKSKVYQKLNKFIKLSIKVDYNGSVILDNSK